MTIKMKNLFEQLDQAKTENNKKEIEKIRNIIYKENEGLLNKLRITDQDLLSECKIELLEIICRYDIKKGLEFSTYALSSLKMHLKGLQIEKHSQISISLKKQILINRTIELLFQKLERKPTVDEIYKEITKKTKMKKTELIQILQASNIISLNQKESEKRETTLEDTLASEEDVEQAVYERTKKEAIIQILKEYLTKEQFETILNRYGFIDDEIKTYREISKKIGKSHEQVRILETQAIKTLREIEALEEFNTNQKKLKN